MWNIITYPVLNYKKKRQQVFEKGEKKNAKYRVLNFNAMKYFK